jgi:RimJ/RimL family protein N-acetyltransferase
MMTLVGKKTRLRAIERSDIPAFVHWLNDPEVTQYLAMYMPMSQAQEERWFEAQLEDRDGFILGIETFDGKLIGNLGLAHIDWKNGQALLGIVIGEKEYWNHGYGADAITALLGFAFKHMNLHRVHLATYEYNERAIKCYQKCGFKLEGRMRQAHFYGGRYHDELVMGILREEFLGK